MDRYFTVMVIPDREKGVKSVRVPYVIFRAFMFFFLAFSVLLIILGYDYWKILKQVHENKHLTIENKQLKEQIQLFQMKVNTITDDIDRINVFEKKLRIITGVDAMDTSRDFSDLESDTSEEFGRDEHNHSEEEQRVPQSLPKQSHFKLKEIELIKDIKKVEKEERFQNLKDLYEQKVATRFGLQSAYAYTKEWNELTKKSFNMAQKYALFDFQYGVLKDLTKKLEYRLHELDQKLLDRVSFLKSMPTLLPTKGWITSYYGPRLSPISRRKKMHEGIDVGAPWGTPILAPADGTITYAGVKPGFGKYVEIDHGYGIETIFAHASKVLVKKGQIVSRGTNVAKVGNTGYSTGPHLHYEVRVNGIPVDPLPYILD